MWFWKWQSLPVPELGYWRSRWTERSTCPGSTSLFRTPNVCDNSECLRLLEYRDSRETTRSEHLNDAKERKKKNLLFGILLNVPNSRWFVVLTTRSFCQSRTEKSMFLSSTTVQESTIPQSYPRSCSDSLALAMSDSVLFRPGLWMLIWWSSTGNRIESTRVSPNGILVTNFPRGNISFQIFLRHFGHFHRRSMYLSWTCRELSFGSDHWGSSKFVRTFTKMPNSAIQMRLQA